MRQIDKDRSANVTEAAISALTAAAGALPWRQYQALLGQYLRLMKRYTKEGEAGGSATKAVVRATCGVLQAFHFPLPETSIAAADVAAGAFEAAAAAAAEHARPAKRAEKAGGAAHDPAEDEAMAPAAPGEGEEGGTATAAVEDDDEDGAMCLDGEGAAVHAEPGAPEDDAEVAKQAYRMLTRRILPELRQQMVAGDTVRAPVALAVVKVRKETPPPLGLLIARCMKTI
jgi:U3 small nucleolar RNA-associated protein 20